MNLENLQKGKGYEFNNELSSIPHNLSIEMVNDFFISVIELFNKDIPESSINKLLLSLAKSLSSQQYLEKFAENDYAKDLPYLKNQFHEQILDLLYIIVSYAPKAMNINVATQFRKLIRTNPRKCLTLLAYFGKQFETIHDPWPMLNLLFRDAEYFRSSECCEDYICLLSYLCQSFEDFRESRQQHCWYSICAALNSARTSTLIAAYSALCSLYEYNPSVISSLTFPSAQVSKHLGMQSIRKYAISLLYRIRPFGNVEGIIDSLIEVAHEDLNANLILIKMASKESNAKYLIQNTGWMINEDSSKLDTVRLFGVILTHSELRSAIIHNFEIIRFLINITSNATTEILTAIGTFVRKLAIEEEFVKELSRSRFLSDYFLAISDKINDKRESDNDQFVKTTMLMVESIAKVCYVKEFSQMCKLLSNLILSNPKYRSIASKASIELCKYKKCAVKFQKLGVAQFFEENKTDLEIGKYANRFLKILIKSLALEESEYESESSTTINNENENDLFSSTQEFDSPSSLIQVPGNDKNNVPSDLSAD